jgi:hypothetical protein
VKECAPSRSILKAGWIGLGYDAATVEKSPLRRAWRRSVWFSILAIVVAMVAAVIALGLIVWAVAPGLG